MFRIRSLLARALCAVVFTACTAGASHAGGEIRIAHIYSKTGPLQAYGKQTAVGLAMGFEYATKGTMMVGDKKIVVTEYDDQGKPDLGRSLLTAAYEQGHADFAIGPTSSGVALAMLPVAEQHKKILIVDPAVSDAITGEKWNRFIFRTARNSSQDAIANAVALDAPGTTIVTLAQESAFGRDGIKAFKEAVKKARVVHEEYLDPAKPDLKGARARLIEALKDVKGRKVIWVLWAGEGSPYTIADDELKRLGIELTSPGNTLPAMMAYNRLPGMQGAAYYYFGFATAPANLWLVTQHYLRYQAPPDVFTAGGFSAAMAAVTALRKSNGATDGETLIKVMEGMSFETPKGTMTFRKEDHQAMQSMYHFRVSLGTMAGQVPDLKLIREITADEIAVPIRNKR